MVFTNNILRDIDVDARIDGYAVAPAPRTLQFTVLYDQIPAYISEANAIVFIPRIYRKILYDMSSGPG
jgi:hypothetical protein